MVAEHGGLVSWNPQLYASLCSSVEDISVELCVNRGFNEYITRTITGVFCDLDELLGQTTRKCGDLSNMDDQSPINATFISR